MVCPFRHILKQLPTREHVKAQSAFSIRPVVSNHSYVRHTSWNSQDRAGKRLLTQLCSKYRGFPSRNRGRNPLGLNLCFLYLSILSLGVTSCCILSPGGQHQAKKHLKAHPSGPHLEGCSPAGTAFSNAHFLLALSYSVWYTLNVHAVDTDVSLFAQHPSTRNGQHVITLLTFSQLSLRCVHLITCIPVSTNCKYSVYLSYIFMHTVKGRLRMNGFVWIMCAE